MEKVIIEGNAVYEIDEECLKKRKEKEEKEEPQKNEKGCD